MVTTDANAGLAANAPVMPAGQPDAASVTAELTPFAPVIVTVDVRLAPAGAVAAIAPKVKLGVALPVTVKVPNCCQVPDW